jgi:Transposase DDE domain
VFISRGIKSSLQRELDSFYKEATGSEFNIRAVTKGSFTKARAKLKYEAFIELNDNVNQTFYNQAPYLVWNQMRLLSVDGTRLVLPNHKSVVEEFGEHGFGPNADSKRSLALASFLYDSLNLTTLDARIAPYSSSERDLLYQHLEKVKTGDLLLLDRGYPSIALLFLLMAKGIEFCIRMKEDWWLSVKEFVESGEKERIVSYTLPQKDRELLKDYPEMIGKEIKCRLICIELENGEKEVLCTSLTDREKYPLEEFCELYHFRWGIEENYKLFKARAEVERFSGKTALAVKQDFFAKVFMMSLSAVLAFPIEERIKKEYREEKTKHPQKINRTSALSMVMSISVGLFLKKLVKKAIAAFDSIVSQTREIVRLGRKNERKKRPKKIYHMNYKPL